MTAVIPKGSLVRLIRESTVDGRRRAGGMEITVGAYFETEGARPYYSGSTRRGINDIVFYAEDVEIVHTAAEQRADTPLMPLDIQRALIDAIDTSRVGNLRVSAVGTNKGAITVTAISEAGVAYEFEVAISNVHAVAA